MQIIIKVGDIKPSLESLIGGSKDLLYTVIRQEAIDALQAPGSKWRVATGLSKSSFDADIRPPVVAITNATTYAEFVEDKYGDARQTLADHFGSTRLTDSISRVLTQHFESRR